LLAAGLTQDDFNNIRALNPYTNPNTNPLPTAISPVDLSRYTYCDQFPYEPGSYVSKTIDLSSDQQATSESDQSVSLSVGFTATDGIQDVLSVSESETFTYSYTTSLTNTTDTSQDATATVSAPSLSWTGPITVYCYVDNVFGSFMFSFAPPPSTT